MDKLLALLFQAVTFYVGYCLVSTDDTTPPQASGTFRSFLVFLFVVFVSWLLQMSLRILTQNYQTLEENVFSQASHISPFCIAVLLIQRIILHPDVLL